MSSATTDFHNFHEMTYDASVAAASGPSFASLPYYSTNQVADYLVNGYWADTGRSARKFAVSTGGTLSYSVDGLEAAGVWFVEKALEAWSVVTGINFSKVSGSNADIVFQDDAAGAYNSSSTSGGTINRSWVNVHPSWYQGQQYDLHSYAYQTYVHEIGHALGLGHGGDYNGSASFPGGAHYANDSWQMSFMSYFSQFENTNINADYAYILTPMIADVAAIQSMYGKPTNANGGNTTWGYNSNAQGPSKDFTSLAGGSTGIAMTVLDTGGEDTFDFSQTAQNQNINLRQGRISDVLGYKGNLIVANGTVIEHAMGGSGSDKIVGNGQDNELFGGGGRDTLVGRSGADQLYGGTGSDDLTGGKGKDRLYGSDGDDELTGGKGKDRFYYDDGKDRITDFKAKQNDKIYIDQDDVPAGMTVRQLLKQNGTVKNGNVHIDFGNGDKLIIEDVSNKMNLVDDILFY